MKTILFTGLAAGSLLFTSCGDKKVDAVAGKDKQANTGVEKDKLKANEAFDNWTKDTAEGRVASLWDSLPSSYQADVSGIVHSVGEKMDAEVYNEAMKTMSAITSLLKDKKSLILEMAKEQIPKTELDKVGDLGANYDSIVGLLNTIATSDAKDVDGLKKLNMARFLGAIQEHTKKLTALANLAGDDMEKIKSATATLVSESGDTAEVEMTVDGSTKKVQLVKTEDRWIPADMAKDWPGMMKEAKGEIGKMAEMEPEQKKQVLDMLSKVQEAIKGLEGIGSKEEMMKKLPELLGPIMSGM